MNPTWFFSRNQCAKNPEVQVPVPESKRQRGPSEGDEETVTTALPREDESPRNMDDKVGGNLPGFVFQEMDDIICLSIFQKDRKVPWRFFGMILFWSRWLKSKSKQWYCRWNSQLMSTFWNDFFPLKGHFFYGQVSMVSNKISQPKNYWMTKAETLLVEKVKHHDAKQKHISGY